MSCKTGKSCLPYRQSGYFMLLLQFCLNTATAYTVSCKPLFFHLKYMAVKYQVYCRTGAIF